MDIRDPLYHLGEMTGEINTDYKMSSNIEIKKVCKCCGQVFVARKTTTECCSHKCSSTLYKTRKRGKLIKIETVKNEKEIFQTRVESIKLKPILTITEASLLVGVSRPTIYSYINNGELECMRMGCKTFIRLSDIFDRFKTKELEILKPSSELSPILEVYTMQEIMDKYKIREAWVYKIVRERRIPKIYKRGRCFYSKPDVDKHFTKPEVEIPITEWYNTEEAMAKFGLTRDALYHYVKYHNIPKVKEGRCIKISKRHLDKIFEQPIIV